MVLLAMAADFQAAIWLKPCSPMTWAWMDLGLTPVTLEISARRRAESRPQPVPMILEGS